MSAARGGGMEMIMNHASTSAPLADTKHTSNERLIRIYTLYISLFFLAATPIAVLYTKEWDFLANLWRILTSPCKLVTDYFALGGLGSTLFNTAVCGLLANLIIYVSKVHTNATTLAGYMLIVAHGFYGLNFINMWPPFVGVLLYCIIMKKKVAENIHIAFFATALAPFVSEVLFRYSVGHFDHTVTQVTWVGVLLAIVCGIAVGFVVLPLLPGTTAMHRGYSLYKAGLAIGLLGIFIYAFMYNTLGIEAPSDIQIDNPNYFSLPYAYRGFMNIFFLIFFGTTFVIVFCLHPQGLREYGKLLKCTGYGTDFTDKFGMPLCMINIAIYGLAIIAYLNLVFLLPDIFPQLPAGVEVALYNWMEETNWMYLDDERANLNKNTDGRILVIADLGLWHGRRQGYKILGKNVADILHDDCDYIEWYSDGHNVKAIASHHDGTNYYEYRVIREDRNIDNLLIHYKNAERPEKWLKEKLGKDPFVVVDALEFDDFELRVSENKPSADDVFNVKLLYSKMKILNDSFASDERLWAGLSHTIFYDYYCDYGFFGVFLFALIDGLLIGYVYKLSQQNDRFKIVYSYFFACLVLQFFSELFFTRFSMILQVIVFSMLACLSF